MERTIERKAWQQAEVEADSQNKYKHLSCQIAGVKPYGPDSM